MRRIVNEKLYGLGNFAKKNFEIFIRITGSFVRLAEEIENRVLLDCRRLRRRKRGAG